jgi:hypothetical protein
LLLCGVSGDVLSAEAAVTGLLADLTPVLDERRLAAAARGLGHGGISTVARETGISRSTIRRVREREQGSELEAGRKRASEHDPKLLAALDELVDPDWRSAVEQVRRHLRAGQPTISIDAKKKELIVDCNAGGCEWEPSREPVAAQARDFPGAELPKAILYGVKANDGLVVVGRDHGTASFAAETLMRWWRKVRILAYPSAKRLPACTDAGGSNGYRRKLWKVELHRLATETGLQITVCYLPPGTSKWNKIEHQLFSANSMSWRGRPLISYEVMVELIGATTTRTGLMVRAERDTGTYPTGVEVTNKELAAAPLKLHKFHGGVEPHGVPKVKCQVSLPTNHFISFQAPSSQ